MKQAWLYVLPWDIGFPGGVNQVVINLINTQKKTQTLTPKLLIDQNSGNANYIASTPVDYFPLTNPCWSPGILGIVKYLIKLPFLLFRLYRYIGNDVQCINPHYPTLNVLNFVLYKKLGFYVGKIILSFHGTDVVSIKKTVGFEKYLWHFIFQHVDFMACCSQKLADELNDYVDNSVEGKIKVIHNGIAEQIIKAATANSGVLPMELDNSRFILNVATFERKKGQDILIRAFAKIRVSVSPIKLVLIGRSTDILINYRQLVSQLDCENDVVFIENLEHQSVLNFFRKANVFCLPSRYEPFGIVLLEAGYFSCPVIASNVGGIPEIIEDGYDGCLISPDNIDELANKLIDLLNNSDMAEKMGRRLRNKVIKTFTWDIAASKYLNLLSNN
ncbi:putative Glycosyl transferase group 1 [Crenothrix polyspora]|uniref:Putative Glycosyl transferase group 1 n=1 Tax=Crenothrix polyspora TaxID=360316 RepID=A0A1R4HIU9_9GAMM|nr:glycosyltransferase family 4 protein [Crenothrix polyspora]SJM96176.1 putative Glycosyl transferase group 1 [Crenothrix polyspora]